LLFSALLQISTPADFQTIAETIFSGFTCFTGFT
jgi:hypothetical protein